MRYSPMMKSIYAVLPDAPAGHNAPRERPMRASEVIDALGRPRSPAAMASVQKSLARLAARGDVAVWYPIGRGNRTYSRA